MCRSKLWLLGNYSKVPVNNHRISCCWLYLSTWFMLSILSDVNECQSSNDCQQVCINTNGSYSCACNVGFHLSIDQQSCIGTYATTCTTVSIHCTLYYCFHIFCELDIDECEFSNCSQICNNTEGSYQCSCKEGFTLLPDNTTCHGTLYMSINRKIEFFDLHKPRTVLIQYFAGLHTDIDECESFQHSCEQTCINQPGSYMCNCSLGFTLSSNGHGCQGIHNIYYSYNF